MRVLQICNKSPWPPVEGGPIAMHQITQGLMNAGVEVMVMAINTPKHYIPFEQIPEDYRKKTKLQLIDVNTNVSAWGFIKNFFSALPYHVERFVNKTFEAALFNTLKQYDFDVIQIETLYMSPYIKLIRQYSKAKVVLRAHNVEYLIWQRLSKNHKFGLKKLILFNLAAKLKRYEANIFDLYDLVVAITNEDAKIIEQYAYQARVYAIPFGIDMNKLPDITVNNEENSFFHIGSMNWKPNEEGVRWLLTEVWDRFHLLHPEIMLHLAGRNMPDFLTKLVKPGVRVIGEVPDAYSFMQQHGVLVAPLFSGSGMRVKIIEAMALGKCVITTSIGAEGIQYIDKVNILIANTVEEFVEAMIFSVKNVEKIKKIGDAARELIANTYNADNLMQKWLDLYGKTS